MQTLQELQEGKLQGVKKLQLSENLNIFPLEIFELADTLEILDLSNNNLSSLPDNLHRLKKLKIAFFANNNFTVLPSAFKECKNLYMLGFKANAIEVFDEDILPLSISWLILTDNKIHKLPKSIGRLSKLQKCALAGNLIEELPLEMQNCKSLELLRLSANQLQNIPSWLLELPKLSWFAFSGNPCSVQKSFSLENISYSDLEIGKLLGEGASGEIYKAYSKDLQKDVAVKIFKGKVTSDGYAVDEMNAYMSTGSHDNLIKVIAKLQDSKRLGLVLEFIPSDFINLGNPPNFDTCTRDTFDSYTAFNAKEIEKIVHAIASASAHLHTKKLMHGDLYAHNILINQENDSYLGDFGAASFYDENNSNYEKIEIRAFGCLIEDLLNICSDTSSEEYENLYLFKEKCMNENVNERPLFNDIQLVRR